MNTKDKRWIPVMVCLGVLAGLSACGNPPAPATNMPEPESSSAPGETVPEGMVIIEAGPFLMGSDDGPESSRPKRQIYLDRYAIDKTEVTVAAYRRYVEATGVKPKAWLEGIGPGKDDMPVTGIIWREASAFCTWGGKRLPTEAEWEKAARGTDGRVYPWGNDWDAGKLNSNDSGKNGVLPVGSFPSGASPFELLDMAGNTAEWVADIFDPAYYLYGPLRNPTGPTQVLDHGLRGGSWTSPAGQTTTFLRDSSHSVVPNPRVGFRCAISL